jgi:hypothetical protein
MGRIALAASVVLGMFVVLPASAHNKDFKTRVTIEVVKPNIEYEGDVISRSAACERRRLLRFRYDNPKGPDFTIGKPFRADRKGHWEFGVTVGENYYVAAERTVKRSGAHRHVCKADRSPTVS